MLVTFFRTGPCFPVFAFMFSLLMLSSNLLFSQKVEVEKKIRRDDFPSNSLQWLEKTFPQLRKDRYFKEYGADTINYEAKFCWNREKYSVEFLKDGSLKDIEKQISFSSVSPESKKNIEEQLDRDFIKWKISRCQEQRVPDRPDKRFEIEIKGSDATGAVMYEYLFDEQGSLVNRQKILLPSNLINQY